MRLSITSLAAFVSTVLIAILAGCGGSSKQAPALVDPGATSANLATSCTKKDCKPANMTYEFSSGLVGRKIEFQKDIDNTITIRGVDADGGTRRVYVLLDGIPSGAMTIPEARSGQIQEFVDLGWMPKKKQRNKSSAPFRVVLRDYDRCVMNTSEKFCQQYSELKDYDKTIEFAWEVVDSLQSDPLAGDGLLSDDPMENSGTILDPSDCDESTTGFDPSTLSPLFENLNTDPC